MRVRDYRTVQAYLHVPSPREGVRCTPGWGYLLGEIGLMARRCVTAKIKDARPKDAQKMSRTHHLFIYPSFTIHPLFAASKFLPPSSRTTVLSRSTAHLPSTHPSLV